MKRLIEFPLEGREPGEVVVVEVDEPGGDAGMERVGRRGEISERATATFEDALKSVEPAASSVLSRMRALAEPPDEVLIEFAIRLSAKAGAVIASADAEANFKITLTWRRATAG